MEQENSSNTAHSGPSQVDRGQVGVIVLIVLAVIATVVMLLSNSEVALRLALLASLWSAVIGFFLVTRYRRQAQSAEQRVADHERFMRQQQESAEGAASGLPVQQARADGSTGVDAERFEEMWASIRAELTVIRTHLEELQEREFGYEPAALQAEARRIRELEQQTDRASSEFAGSEFSYQQPGGQYNGGVGFASGSGVPSQEAIAGKLGSQPSQPQPNPLSALISEREQEKRQQQARQQTAKPASKPAHKPADQQTEKRKPAAKPQASAGKSASAAAEPKRSEGKRHDAARSSDPVFDTSRFHAVRWDSVGEERKENPSQNTSQRTSAVKSEPEQSAATSARTTTARTNSVRDDSNRQGAGSHAAPQQPQVAASEQRNDDESRTRRRRRDENTGGISVAELLKRSKK